MPPSSKEYIFGMLFLKRCSDVFEGCHEAIVRRELDRGRLREEVERRANHPSFYTDTFFVPPAARWQHLWDELHHNVGDGLNKALAVIEEHNTSLDGVLTHIDFNRRVGQSRIPTRATSVCSTPISSWSPPATTRPGPA